MISTQNRQLVSLPALVLGCVCVSNALTSAAELYTLNVTGPGNLLHVNTATGAATPTFADATLGSGSWNGLSASPTDPHVLYAVNNPRPATLDAPQFSRLARIDLTTGAAALFPLFEGETLGISEVFSSALAISPREPHVAVVAGFNSRTIPPTRLLWQVDTLAGEVLGPALTISAHIESLTFGPDGNTLFGTDDEGRLITVEPDTGTIAPIGDPGLSSFLTGLAFHPTDGTLFAIDAFTRDRLVILDPANGALIADLGPMGISGPEGLAFVPEPSGWGLLVWGLLVVAGRRRMMSDE